MAWEIKVASYNIHKAIGRDRKRSPARILAVLAELDADVVVLQEADMRFGSRQSVLPPSLIAQHSPYRPVALGAAAGSLGWHGNAVLVREGATISGVTRITLPAIEPRGSVVVELDLKGHQIRIVGMHLDLSGLRRAAQARAIVGKLSALPPLPTVVVGDTNEWRSAGRSLKVLHTAFESAHTGPSFPAARPLLRLDRMMVDASFRILQSGVHTTVVARDASDHLPIWARLARREETE